MLYPAFMGKAGAACIVVLAVVLASRPGRAQEGEPRPQAAPAKKGPQPLSLRREAKGAQATADVGRARMRSGDWSGALEALDNAARESTDPSVRRDRGVCHEHLGNAYPAIDDFRAYLTALPDAPDSEAIRERLAKLEQETLGYSSASTDAPGDVEGGASATARAAARKGPSRREVRGRDPLDYVDREDDPLNTPVKRGKGWSFAPLFFVHKWGIKPAQIALPAMSAGGTGSSFGDSGTWAEGIGLDFRYSFGPSLALLIEAAYEHFNSTTLDLAVVSGLSSQVALEWRIPFDAEYDDQFIVAPGLGYEHLAVQPGDAQTSGTSVGGFVPRVRLGWRHLLTPSAGLDVALDGGAVNFFEYAHFPYDSANETTFLVGFDAALVWGM